MKVQASSPEKSSQMVEKVCRMSFSKDQLQASQAQPPLRTVSFEGYPTPPLQPVPENIKLAGVANPTDLYK